jgi:hypothetical protein
MAEGVPEQTAKDTVTMSRNHPAQDQARPRKVHAWIGLAALLVMSLSMSGALGYAVSETVARLHASGAGIWARLR